MLTKISSFLFCRGLSFNFYFNNIKRSLFSDSLNSFAFSAHQFSFSSLQRFLLIHKNKLKQIIKNSFNLSISSLISLLNREVVSWVYCYSYFFNSIRLNKSLDLYLYKLLWKFVKRCHPRRSNTWIYNKYWKRFSNTWRFSIFDTALAKYYCVKLHNCNLYRYPSLPLSLEVFNALNYKKFFSVLFKKSLKDFNGIYRFLFIKQKGLCFCCFKPIQNFNCKLFRMKRFVSVGFMIIHTYCFL